MKRSASVAVAEAAARPARARADLSAVRGRLAEATERDAVALDFLEDDLQEARLALRAVRGWLGEVASVLGKGGGGPEELLALALGRGPLERVEVLADAVGSIRRRLARLSGRLGPAPGYGSGGDRSG